MHADFMTGWKTEFLQQAIETCTNPSGRIEDCPLFDVVDQGTATSCKLDKELPSTLLGEVKALLSPMDKLPGHLMVFGDDNNPLLPEVGGENTPTATSKPTLDYTPGVTASNTASPLPGQVFKQVDSDAESSSAPAPAPAPTTPSAPVAVAAAVTEAPSSTEVSYWSTQYVTTGNTVMKIFWDQEVVTVTETEAATETAAPAQRRRSHLHAHARRS